jgi:hypothetical protein
MGHLKILTLSSLAKNPKILGTLRATVSNPSLSKTVGVSPGFSPPPC